MAGFLFWGAEPAMTVHRQTDRAILAMGRIRKSGYRFSEKIVLKQ
jgi:hypothetical protein